MGVWIHRSQNLNKAPLLLVTARFLARLSNTNGWSPVTFLTLPLPSHSHSVWGCWLADSYHGPLWVADAMWEPSPSQAWTKRWINVMCYCLMQGWAWRYHAEVTYHVVSIVFEAGGPCPGLFAGLLWPMAFMTGEFLFGQNHPPWMQLSQISEV